MTGFPVSWALLARLRSNPIIEKRCFLADFKLFVKKKAINQNQEKKMEIVNQDLDGSLSLSLSTEIPIYMERDLSMNRSRLSSIRIDMSL